MPVVILPHPDTRECLKHRGEYEIPGVRACVACEMGAAVEHFRWAIARALRGAEPKASTASDAGGAGGDQ